MTTDYGLEPTCRPVDLVKDPSDIIDIPFHWAKELAGDTIDSSDVLLPDGLTEEDDTLSGTTTRIVRVSGGSACGVYRVTNRIVTDDGRQFDKTVRVVVRDK